VFLGFFNKFPRSRIKGIPICGEFARLGIEFIPSRFMLFRFLEDFFSSSLISSFNILGQSSLLYFESSPHPGDFDRQNTTAGYAIRF
jgi:hypothetical protein